MSKDQFFEEQENSPDYPENPAHISAMDVVWTLNKINAVALKEYIKEAILSGRSDVFRFLEGLTFIGKVADEIKTDADIIDIVTSEIKKYGKEYISQQGVKFDLAETGTRYNYSQTAEWVRLYTEEQDISKRRKLLEEKLKTIPAGKLLVDPDTGETLTGPSKTSKSSFKITLPKE